MGIFTRLFRGQDEVEADESQSSEEEPMDSGQAKPTPPSEEGAPLASGTDDGTSSDSDSDRQALLSATPRLAGGLRVAARPRKHKKTDPPSTNGESAKPAPVEKKPPRSARTDAGDKKSDPTDQVAVPPPANSAKPRPRPRAAAPSPPPSPPKKPTQKSKTSTASKRKPTPPATPKPTAAARTRPQGSAPNPLPPGDPESADKRETSPPSGKRRRRSPISEAFDSLLEGDKSGGEGVSSDSDRAEVQGVFDDLAAGHVEAVRNVMLELEVEDVGCSWIESSKPPLMSLRKMAAEMELDQLCAAIDSFCEAIDAAVGSGQSTVTGESKSEIQKRYNKLIDLIPTAFALEGERDRREPIIVESLLRQVPGVEKITIDKLFSVGLDKLSALIRSNADDIAATSGIDAELARAIAERFRQYRQAVPSAVAARDSAAERARLGELLDSLKRHHRAYNDASAGWSDDDRRKKREARRLREATFLQVRVALARLGETDSLQQIEKRPFDQRIAAVEKLLEKEDHGRAHP